MTNITVRSLVPRTQFVSDLIGTDFASFIHAS
jgi:hypothetical protein